jgi:hypothetical protein
MWSRADISQSFASTAIPLSVVKQNTEGPREQCCRHQELHVAFAATYLREPIGYGWPRHQNRSGCNGPQDDHNDLAVFAAGPQHHLAAVEKLCETVSTPKSATDSSVDEGLVQKGSVVN